MANATPTATPKRPIYRNLTFQVLVAVALGILVGILFPNTAQSLQVLGELFIRMIKMIIAPIIFLTIVLGIGSMGSLKKVGRVGGKALLYFEVVTTFAIVIGLLVAYWLQPGQGVAPPTGMNEKVKSYADASQGMDWSKFLLHIIPDNVVGAFAAGDIIQVVFFSVLFGLALTRMGAGSAQTLRQLFEQFNTALFRVLEIVMRLAPLGAFGGMAYTVGKFGPEALLSLAKLMLAVYVTMAIFIFVVLNLIARAYGFSLWRFLGYIKSEILIVLGTSSSESVLPRMMEKLERAGCSRSVVGLVVPTGYSFNLDGTSIYLSMATVFLAQVYQVTLSWEQLLAIVGVLMVTSKGAAAVAGGGFVVLASTLAALQVVPVEGMALLLGVDRFMSEARAITNLIGNGVATMVVAKSENDFNAQQYEDIIRRRPADEDLLPAAAAVADIEEDKPAQQ